MRGIRRPPLRVVLPDFETAPLIGWDVTRGRLPVRSTRPTTRRVCSRLYVVCYYYSVRGRIQFVEVPRPISCERVSRGGGGSHCPCRPLYYIIIIIFIINLFIFILLYIHMILFVRNVPNYKTAILTFPSHSLNDFTCRLTRARVRS